MTTANFMGITSVKGKAPMQMNVSKKLKEEDLETAEFFAGLMNQTMGVSDSAMNNTKPSKISEGSFERYSYVDKQINPAKKSTTYEKLEEASGTLKEKEEEIIDTLSEKYGVDEEEIKDLLDEMGLSAYDLLNPQNLVNFIEELTGAASGALLLDENFLSVMETLGQMADELMSDLNVDMDGLNDLVAQMDKVEQSSEDVEMLTATEMQGAGLQDDSSIGQEAMDGQNSENFSANEGIVQTQTMTNVGQMTDGMSTQQFSSYLSADSVQIMEQIVQRMRVTISDNISSMEMQMNPENLGKVYVNISSEDGIVNAQFRATNEVVKEALEAQLATLRENLNQAGVKVDAIEVTIASHEFERNLEQNNQNSDEQMNAQEEQTKKRRNLTVDSLDELTGMMTEEETLVAQIMKDNGNSVDFIA